METNIVAARIGDKMNMITILAQMIVKPLTIIDTLVLRESCTTAVSELSLETKFELLLGNLTQFSGSGFIKESNVLIDDSLIYIVSQVYSNSFRHIVKS
jgi:hypothetical protein